MAIIKIANGSRGNIIANTMVGHGYIDADFLVNPGISVATGKVSTFGPASVHNRCKLGMSHTITAIPIKLAAASTLPPHCPFQPHTLSPDIQTYTPDTSNITIRTVCNNYRHDHDHGHDSDHLRRISFSCLQTLSVLPSGENLLDNPQFAHYIKDADTDYMPWWTWSANKVSLNISWPTAGFLFPGHAVLTVSVPVGLVASLRPTSALPAVGLHDAAFGLFVKASTATSVFLTMAGISGVQSSS